MLHSPWSLQVLKDAIWLMQHAHYLQAFDAKLSREAESDLHVHIPRQYNCLLSNC